MDDLRELYQDMIVDHNRSPRHFHPMDDATQQVKGYNPLCGDDYTIYVKIHHDVLQSVSFTGHGCAISKASASVMCSMLIGKTVTQANELFATFHSVLTEGVAENQTIPTKIAAFSGVRQYPIRIKCATLPWHGLHSALSTDETETSTEEGL